MKQIITILILVFTFQMCSNKYKAPEVHCDERMEFVLDSLKEIIEFDNASINSYHYDSNSLSSMYTEDIVKVELFNAYSINNGNVGLIAYDVIQAVCPIILNKDDFSRFEVSFIFPDEPDICLPHKEIKLSYSNEELALPKTIGPDFMKISLENKPE